MTMYRVQCTLPYESGLPEDVITNTFHFEVDGAWGSTQDAGIVARMVNYYEEIYEIDDTFSMIASYVQHSLIIRVFEANPAVSPNPPVFVTEQPLSIAGTTVNGLPAEVAIVSSQHSALAPGARLGRYFNRHYLGGFTTRVLDATTDPLSPPVVRSAIRDRFAQKAEDLRITVGDGLEWVIGRQSSGTWVPVNMTGGFVGDEPDTQRRRGPRQAARSNWTA